MITPELRAHLDDEFKRIEDLRALARLRAMGGTRRLKHLCAVLEQRLIEAEDSDVRAAAVEAALFGSYGEIAQAAADIEGASVCLQSLRLNEETLRKIERLG